MTVQSENSKAVYIANGTTTSFVIPFYFFNHEIVVMTDRNKTPLEEGTDYDLCGAGEQQGGEVVFKTAPLADTKIIIKRCVPLTQLVTFIEGENFPARDYEYSLDRLIMALQAIRDCLSRCVMVSEGAEKTPEELYELMLKINDNFGLIKQVPELADKVLTYYQKIMTLLENYVTKTEMEERLDSYYIKSEVDRLIEHNKTLKISNVTVNSSDVVEDGTYETYPYRLDIPVEFATTAHVPSVVFEPLSADSGIFAPVASAFDGYVRIYLKEIFQGACITIPTILLH